MTIRRRDFSKYLVHLTREYEGAEARDNLLSILSAGIIEARTPLGSAVKRLEYHGCDTEEAMNAQRVCCFSETPLDDLGGLIDPGVWRRNHFQPYGVVFERETLLLKGVNPVWYLNSYNAPGVNFPWLVKGFNAMVADVIATAGDDREEKAATFLSSPLSEFAPFVETIGVWGNTTKDFSFEREWRHRGDLEFKLSEVAAIVTPAHDEDAVRNDLLTAADAQEIAHIVWRHLDEDEVLDP